MNNCNSFSYSIIIPYRNSPQLLKRLLHSIPERDDIQIIVVDDNSELLYKPSLDRNNAQIVTLNANESKGAGRARNVGIKYAKGKWILFADSDDLYKEGFIDILDKYVYENIDVLYFNCEFADSQSLNVLPPINISRYVSKYDGSKNIELALKYKNNAPWSKMIRRSYLEKYGFLFEEIPNGNDYMFSLLVGYFCNKYLVCKDIVYIYTKNCLGLTNKKKMSNQEHFYRLAYFFKTKSFFRMMNICEGKDASIILYLLHLLKSKGGSEFLKAIKVLICNYRKLYCLRNTYINTINQHKKAK